MRALVRIFCCIALLSGFLPPAQAQAPRFEARTSLRKVIAGETFELTFTLYNAPGGQLAPPDLRDWQVVGGPTTSQGSQTLYVNGRMSHQKWTEYGYLLRAPDRPGRYTIGRAQISAAGQTLFSKPLEVEVVKAASPNPNAKRDADISLGDEVILRAEPHSRNTFAGEQVLIDFRLYFRVPLQEFDVLSLPDILNANVTELEEFDPSLEDRMLNGKTYSTQVLRRLAVCPLADGPLAIGPLRIRVLVPVNNPWSLFFSQAMPYELESVPFKLNILPAPPPPPGANGGGVGDFRVYASLDKTALSTDEALSIALTIEGQGDLRALKAPTLRLPQDSFEVFEPAVEDEPMPNENGAPQGRKRFVWTILPRLAAPSARIPLDFTYLDTRSRSYRRFDTAFTVQISQGAQSAGSAATLDYARQDIRPYHANGLLEAEQRPFFGSTVYLGLWGLLFLGLLTTIFLRFFPREKLFFFQKNIPFSPKTSPSEEERIGHPLLAKALAAKNAGDANGFYRAVYEWLKSQPDSAEVTALRQACEMVLFAGVSPGDLHAFWKRLPIR